MNREAHPREWKAGDWENHDGQDLLKKVQDAGIIGVGGAGFPTHVKLNPPADNPVDTLILNGAECEPYITADHRQMVEHASEIIEGVKILLKILGIPSASSALKIISRMP